MKTVLKIIFALAFMSALSGCGVLKPYYDSDVLKVAEGNVVRMNVRWYEKANKAYAPASYNVEAYTHHWGPNAIQYRWILVQANFHKDVNNWMWTTAMIPDGMPILSLDDVVDVYVPTINSINYDALQGPVILRFVCKHDDKPCKEKSKAELGGANEVVSHGKPDMSGLTFSKKFDTEGNLLQK